MVVKGFDEAKCEHEVYSKEDFYVYDIKINESDWGTGSYSDGLNYSYTCGKQMPTIWAGKDKAIISVSGGKGNSYSQYNTMPYYDFSSDDVMQMKVNAYVDDGTNAINCKIRSKEKVARNVRVVVMKFE